MVQRRTGLAAIGVSPDCPIAPSEVERGDGYVAAKFQDFVLYSCYFSPNRALTEFEDYLGALEASMSRWQSNQIILAGDFNAKSEDWHSGRTDRRGYVLGELAIQLDLAPVNAGSTPTRFHQGYGSVIDITFATESLAHRIKD